MQLGHFLGVLILSGIFNDRRIDLSQTISVPQNRMLCKIASVKLKSNGFSLISFSCCTFSRVCTFPTRFVILKIMKKMPLIILQKLMNSFERNQLSSSEKFGPLGTLKKNMPWKLIGYTYLLNYYDGFEIRHNSLGYMKYGFLSALSNLVRHICVIWYF